MNSDFFRISGPDVVFEDFDGDLVVLNLSTGQYFGFNPTAALLWQAVVAGSDAQTVASAWPRPGEVESFIERLVSLGLIIPAEASESADGEDFTARFSGVPEAPEVNVFEDLADLILADPIHDTVEEAGWPVRAE